MLQGGSLLGLSLRNDSTLQDNNYNYTLLHKNHMIHSSRPMARSIYSERYGPTWAISCLSVLLRAMQGRTDNYKTAIQLNDEEEVSLLFRDPCI
jgi:hypothetical protein